MPLSILFGRPLILNKKIKSMRQMSITIKKRALCFSALVLAISIMVAFPREAFALPSKPDGGGTFDNPYLVASRDELEWIASRVNCGESFSNCLFVQTRDIDLEGEPWKAIGGSTGGVAFAGTYNGCGHSIDNLVIKEDDSALFHTVAGRIINLSIDGGRIEGSGSAAIAAHSKGNRALIANCISDVDVIGDESSGVTVDFPDGTIATSVYTGVATGQNSYGIVAKASDVKLYRTYSASETWLSPNGVVSTNSFVLPIHEIKAHSIASKLSLSSAICNDLFLGGVDQELWEWRIDDSGDLSLSAPGAVTHLVALVSEWSMAALAGALLAHRLIEEKRAKKAIRLRRINDVSVITTTVEIATVGLCDAYCITRGIDGIELGPLVFILIMHLHLCVSLATIISSVHDLPSQINYPLIIVLIAMITVEVMQFGNVPRYDANIYYGSFAEGCRIFNLNLISFLGSFNCWKWAQGVAIFCAPFEFFFPGEIIGLYIGNLIVSIITLLLFNSLLKKLYTNIGDVEKAIYCAVFAFSPYIVGLFSYFDMDWNVACYIVWLLYALACKNDKDTVIAGLLLAFTKITGVAFYCLVLLLDTVMEISRSGWKFKVIKEWMSPSRLMHLMMPAFLYLGLLIFGDDLTAQAFFGTYVSEEGMIDWFDIDQIANTLLQSFIFCFRWMLLVLLLSSLVIAFRKKNGLEIISSELHSLFLSIPVAATLTVLVLCIYNSDANCPRYTSFLSPIYALLMPFAVKSVIPCRWEKRVLWFCLTLFCIQTFITIDPAVILYCKKMETGSFPLYKLAYRNDMRPGMNLTSGPNGSTDMLGDLYTYNVQYSFYDNLLDQVLKIIKPNSKTVVYSYNLGTYEMNLSGRGYGSYNIYYDPVSGKRNFNGENILIDFRELGVSETDVEPGLVDLVLPDSFWVLVPYRFDPESAAAGIVKLGYCVESETKIENIFGSLVLLRIEKNEQP